MISELAEITTENTDQLRVVGTLAGHTAPILSIDVVPKGRLLASGSMDGTARLWDLPTQKQVSVLTDNADKEAVSRVAFSPTNPHHLATAIGRKPHWVTPDIHSYVGNLFGDSLSPYTKKPVWRLWSVENESVIHTEKEPHPPQGTTAGLTYSRDGHWLAANGCVYDITAGSYRKAVQLTEYHVSDMAFSDDSRRLAQVTCYEKMPERVLCRSVEIYRVDNWKKITAVKETRRISDFAAVRFLPNSHELLVRTRRDTMRGRDAHKLYHFKGDEFEAVTHVMSDVACFACHPNVSLVAIAKYDGRIVLLDWNRKRRQKPIAAVQAYKPTKRIEMPIFAIENKGSKITQEDTVKSHYRASADMVFSLDGKRLISADGDWVIRLWGVPA